ncbi:hypothetical protein E2I00_009553 [Balaenoptera physalus]|uniref:Uncharacterized protein n=1 Tax=Balaenoptera physalus TaxID=9770 RepID=A0A6A1QBG3_BALPH|nr:hypothetical protein E2I00_009553 [Balaenoptera physalus]
MQRSKMKGASSGKRTAGPQQKSGISTRRQMAGIALQRTPFSVREEDKEGQTEEPWEQRWWQHQ